jgi:signal transduction histidine kinase
LVVTDNGTGMGARQDEDRGRGLKNLRSRADKLSGTFESEVPDGGGTRIIWSVPC